VAIVNELFVKTFLAGKDPLTQSFQIEGPIGEPRPNYQIIGVVKNSKYTDLREPMAPLVYLHSAQDLAQDPSLQAVVRTTAPIRAVTTEIIQAIREVNPIISLQFTTMEQTVRDSLLSERLMASLSAFFGVLAAFIATIGLYGVMSYMVARRRTEIGIRMALGADRRRVLGMVLREASLLLVIGLLVGIGLAVAGGRAAGSLLYGLKPWDATTLLVGIVGLAAIAILASWLPAHRATRVEPTVALRTE
jgi:ABC-type antimicrobial peptide transport system permease subunit